MTPKQERFVQEYLIDMNATRAAIRAGYSAKTAEQQGHQLLKKTSVAAALLVAQAIQANRMAITADSITTRLMTIADQAEAMDTPAALSVARQSIMDVAKLNGLVVETSETITRTPEERARRLAELRAERDRLAKRRLN